MSLVETNSEQQTTKSHEPAHLSKLRAPVSDQIREYH